MERLAARGPILGLALFVILLLGGNQAHAQGPGGGRGGPGGGPGGPGFGTDPLSLIQIAAVQDELKLNDKQKAKLTEFRQSVDQQRRQVFEQLRNRPANPDQGNGNGEDGGFGNGGGGGNNGNGGDNGGGGGQGRGRGGFDREAMRAAMEEFQQTALQSLAKILDKTQRIRLDQIALQAQGVLAVARDDIAQKLNMSEEQQEMVHEVVAQRDQSRRDLFRAQWANRPRGDDAGGPPAGNGGRRRNGNNGDNPGAAPDNAGTGGNGGPGGNNGPGGNGGNNGPGGNGGRGGRGGGFPDLNDPAVRARFDEMRTKMEALDSTAEKQVGKILRKNQKLAFNKMLGKEFDVSVLRPQWPGGPGSNPNPNATPTTTTPAVGTPKSQAAKPATGRGSRVVQD